MKFKAIMIGATGATGRRLLELLIEKDTCSHVTSIGRRNLHHSQLHSKLNHITIDSLLDLTKTEDVWKNNDVFFNCIGTTKKKAGSADKFFEIEYGISNEAARVASLNNIPHACLISASGANHSIWAKKWIHPLFYSKTMGQKEQSIVSNFTFEHTSIFQPGMLIRRMNVHNTFDRILEITGLGLEVSDLAKAMIKDAENVIFKRRNVPNLVVHGNNNIRLLIKE